MSPHVYVCLPAQVLPSLVAIHVKMHHILTLSLTTLMSPLVTCHGACLLLPPLPWQVTSDHEIDGIKTIKSQIRRGKKRLVGDMH